MKTFLYLLGIVGLLLPYQNTSASEDRASSEKEIMIIVGGELNGQDVSVYLRDGETSRKIMQFKGVGSGEKQKAHSIKTMVSGTIVELKVVAGKMEYVFDVEVEPGMQCTFHKGEDSIYLQRKAGEDVSSTDVGNLLGAVSHDIYMRFLGDIVGKRVELYVDSHLIFDERLQSDLLSYCKEERFKTEKSLFNVRIVVDGCSSSFDIDAAKGCYIDFNFRNRYLKLKQYLSEDAMPGLL